MAVKNPPMALFGGDVEKMSAARLSHIGKTEVAYTTARSVLTRATGFLDAYDFSLNPYSGCTFGCTYCYAAFFSRSKEKRDTWGHWVDVKENAVELLATRRSPALTPALP